MNGPALAAIRAGLDRVGQAGRRLPVWWRDDDAVRDTPALERLLGLSRRFAMPVAVAAVPALLEPSLAHRVREEPGARVLVHGWRHANHAPSDEKPAEFGPHRSAARMGSELRRGREAIRRAFGEQALDVFVPPWNRIGPGAAELLAGAGYIGLSTFGSSQDVGRGTLSPGRVASSLIASGAKRTRGATPPPLGRFVADAPRDDGRGVVTIDTHIDPVDWRGTRGLLAPELIAARFVRALSGSLDSGSEQPIGLLTHHLAMDEATWSFCEELVETVLSHPSVYTPELDGLWHIGQPT